MQSRLVIATTLGGSWTTLRQCEQPLTVVERLDYGCGAACGHKDIAAPFERQFGDNEFAR